MIPEVVDYSRRLDVEHFKKQEEPAENKLDIWKDK